MKEQTLSTAESINAFERLTTDVKQALLTDERTRREDVESEFERRMVFEDQMPTISTAPIGEPLTQKDLDKMHFERVWIDYGSTPDNKDERSGEEGVVLYGRLYSIDTLEGAGFEEMLLDAIGNGGETLDIPSGNYTLYRFQSGMERSRTDAAEALFVGMCKECANSPDIGTHTKGMRWCRKFRSEVPPNGFCHLFELKGGKK